MVTFSLKQPSIKNPGEIETLSLETIMNEASTYPEFERYNAEQKKIIQRMIHSTTCFEQIINNICFTENAVEKMKQLLSSGASIITDTNMIKTGISKAYTEKFNNDLICYVSDAEVKQIAANEGITRTFAAVKKALQERKNQPAVLACGNAPTFIYAAIESLILEEWDLSNISLLAMPVGFINVEESKEYALEFLKLKDAEGIVLKGRYGGSTLIVSAIHAIYKMII